MTLKGFFQPNQLGTVIVPELTPVDSAGTQSDESTFNQEVTRHLNCQQAL